jgi:hypothetical protein
MPSGPSPEELAARAADDAALAEGAERLGFLQDHFVAVSGGEILGGAMLAEDVRPLLQGSEASAQHAYFFRVGEEGDGTWSAPALYADRMVGDALWAALGVDAARDPSTGATTLSSAGTTIDLPTRDGSTVAVLGVRPHSGLGTRRVLSCVIIPEFDGAVVLSASDRSALALRSSEIPGRRLVGDVLTGRTLDCRRSLCLVELLDGEGEDARVLAAGLSEVAAPEK